MPSLNDLPADQAAVLRLLVGGMDAADIATALSSDEAGVMSLALNGIGALAGEAGSGLTEGEKLELGEWIIGSRSQSDLADNSPAARRYIDSVAEGLGGPSLPFSSPPAGNPSPDAATTLSDPPPRAKPAPPVPSASADEAPSPASPPAPVAPPPRLTSPASPRTAIAPDRASSSGEASKRGGIALLAGAALAIVALILWATGTFNADDHSQRAQASPQPSTSASQSAQSAATAQFVPQGKRQYPLRSAPKAKIQGLVSLGTKSKLPALAVAATGMPPSSVIGVWLTGGANPLLVGVQKTDAKGNFTAEGLLPQGAAQSSSLIITQESYTPGGAVPRTPGRVLLSTDFSG